MDKLRRATKREADRHRALLVAGAALALWVGCPRETRAACQVTAASGTVDCDQNTATTFTTNTNGSLYLSSDRTQLFTDGKAIDASIQPGTTVSGNGLALTEQVTARGATAPITLINAGQLTTSLYGNALQLNGDGGLITYFGNGGITSTSTSSNGGVNGGAALDTDNVGAGSIAISTGSGTISGPQGIDASTTGSGSVALSTTSGAVFGTSAQAILASTNTGAISLTIGSGGASSLGLGWPAIQATSTGGAISIIANGAVIGGGYLADPATAPPGIYAVSNGAGDIEVGGSGTVTGPAGRGIWAVQSSTSLGGILITGTGATHGAGTVCPPVSLKVALSTGELGCSGIRAEIDNPADQANVTVNRSGDVSGTSTAIDARSAGSGTITIDTGLNAQLSGTYGYGLEAKASGTGSILISMTGAKTNVETGGVGIIAVNDDAAIPARAANTITVNTGGTITSTANPVSQSNLYNPLGVLAGISAGYVGGQAITTNPNVNGSVVINNVATIQVPEGDGILSFHFGAGSSTAANSGMITAPIGIALAGSRFVQEVINNSGTINSTVAAIDATGAGAPVTINQTAGQLTGAIMLSGHGDTLNISGGAINGNIVGNSAVNGANAGTVTFSAPGFTTAGTIDVAAINLNAGSLTLADDVTVFNAFTNNATLQLAAQGTRTITGNYSQGGAGTLVLAVGPGGSAQLAVTGAANLAGTLSLQYAPGTYTARTYALVTAGGGVSGTFSATVESGSVPTLTRGVTYTSNAVNLVIGTGGDKVAVPDTTTPATTAAAAATAVAATGTVVSGTVVAGTVVSGTVVSGTAVAAAAPAAADPPPPAAAVVVRPGDEALFSAQDATLALLANRSVSALLGTDDAPACGGPGTAARGPAEDALARTPFCRAGGWVQFADSPLQAHGSGGVAGFSANTAHVLLGADGPVWGERLRLGMALGYDQTWLSDDAGGDASGQVVRLGVYGSMRLDPVLVTAAVSYGIDQLRTLRETGVGRASESHGGSEVSGGVQARMPIAVGAYTVTPMAGVRFAVLNENGFVESGAGAVAGSVVSGGRNEFNTIVPYGRVKVGRRFTTADGWEIDPAVQVGYDYQAGNAGPPVTLFAGDGTTFTSHALKLDRSSAVLGVGISVGRGNWEVVGGIHANIAGNWSSQTAEASYRVRF